MSELVYFAYGSNMLSERLWARCSSARPLGVAWTTNYSLFFNKMSIDGSSKANLVSNGGGEAKTYGVLFSIARSDIDALHQFETCPEHYGFEEDFIVYKLNDGTRVNSVTYLARPSKIVENQLPYNWYLDLIIAGARQHEFPFSYIAWLEGHLSRADPEPGRERRVEALELLKT